MKSFFTIFAIAVLATLSGCYDKQYPPYFHNESGKPAQMSVAYVSDHPATVGTLPPHVNGGHAEKDLVIKSIDVRFENGTEHSLGLSDIKSLREKLGQPEIEVWLISESGIRLGDKNDWEKIISKGK